MSEQERVVTPKFRVSFPFVFTPNKNEKGVESYSVVMMFDKNSDLTKIKELYKKTVKEKYGDKVPKNFQSPFKNGNDKDLDKYPDFKDKILVTAKSKFQPGLIDQHKEELLDPKDFYAGCYARASVTTYPWEYMGKVGINFGLQNIQKLADGEKLGGGVTAADEFDVVESDTPEDDGFDDFEV